MSAVLALAGCSWRTEAALMAPGLPAPASVALASPSPRSDLLLRAVAQILEAAELSPQQLKLIVVTRGPGSFTGLRNTLACAAGLAQALAIPAHGFSSLLVQAARTRESRVLAVQPARRSWVYAQRFSYRNSWEAESEVEIVPLEALERETWSVVAPPSLSLPAGCRSACTALSTSEALLGLAQELKMPDQDSLSPIYIETFPRRREEHGSFA